MTIHSHSETQTLKGNVLRRMIQVIITLIIQAAILFLAAGQLDWDWAWVFLGLYLLGISINAWFMLRYSPETIAERAKTEGMKGWDKALGGLFAVMYFVGIPLIAGLDLRFEWSGQVNLAFHLAGVLVFALGSALFSWAMISNVYFATIVRVQRERGHQVCTSGPYQWVRHPGYLGAVLQSLGLPLMLGSWWALVAGGLATPLLIARTVFEDQTLHEELDGYRAYATQVRYRLLPGVW